MRFVGWAGIIGACLVLAACSGEEAPAPRPAPSALLTPAGDLDCPGQAALAADPRARLGNLTGDIDGDGEADEVALVADEDTRDPACRYFLVVETNTTRYSVALAEEGAEGSARPPNLVTVAQIDGRGGLDVVVSLLAGASTDFSGVFILMDDELERLEVPNGPAGDLFPTGGTVANIAGSDCAGDGRVVISEAIAAGAPGRYQVTRRIYEADEGRPALGEPEVETFRAAEDELQRLPEFVTSPFGSCPAS